MGSGGIEGKRGRATRRQKLLPLIGVFIATVAFALVAASSAGAATVLSQDFESGLGGWTTTGFWHVQNNPQTIAVNPAINPALVTLPDSGALPAAFQGSNVAWFGEASTGTYCGATSINNPNFTQGAKGGCTSVDANGNSTTQTGDLTSPSFSLAGLTSPALQFASWWEIEGVAPTSFDTMEVEYSLNGGVTYTSLGTLNPTSAAAPTSGSSDQDFTNNGLEVPATWKLYSFNLAALAGQPNVKLRFHFDTGDSQFNGFRGWLVDSIVVSGNGGPPAASTGPTSVSSTSATFTGSVNPQGVTTAAAFQYGLDPSYTGGGSVTYTNQVTAQPNPVGSDSTSHNVTASVSGLVPNALYHVRVVAASSGGTSFGPDATFRTNKAGVGKPALGKSFNAAPVSGRVFVKMPGSSTGSIGGGTGPGFVPLTQTLTLPAGTQIDVRFGSIKITTATGNKGKKASKLQNGTFSGGIFSEKQARSGGNRGLVTLKLLYGLFPGAPSFASCTATGAEVHAPFAHVAVSGSVLSTLRSRSHGRYSTSGHYGSATSRGTAWTITDRCKSTLITVQQDTVVVRNFVNHKTRTLRAGQRLLIKARR